MLQKLISRIKSWWWRRSWRHKIMLHIEYLEIKVEQLCHEVGRMEKDIALILRRLEELERKISKK